MVNVDGLWCFCRICSPDDESTWDDGDRTPIADVSDHGWHLVWVHGDDDGPGWCYTVGLWHSFRSPEVAMLGLRVEDMPCWLNAVGEHVRQGNPPRPNEIRAGIVEGVPVTWRPVHDSWYRELFGYALWFTSPPLPIDQQQRVRGGRWRYMRRTVGPRLRYEPSPRPESRRAPRGSSRSSMRLTVTASSFDGRQLPPRAASAKSWSANDIASIGSTRSTGDTDNQW